MPARVLPSVGRALERVTRTFRRHLAAAPPHLQQLKLQYLREVDIFQDLTHEEMVWLKESTRMVTCPAGQIIYDQRDPAEALFILKRGRVQLYRLSPEGKKLEIDTLEPGTFFGEMPLIDQHMRETFAEAVEDSLVCILDRDDLERVILRKPQIAIRILDVLSQRLGQQAIRLEALAFYGVTARSAGALLRFATGDVVRATHQQLAEAIGVYRESVTKALAELQRQGLVELKRKQITLKDRPALESMARGEPERQPLMLPK